MASNSLLISSYSKQLEELTKNFVKIPMYKNPYDARHLCQYALNNPNYCEDIILACNEFIEKYGRWEDNFKIIEETINVNLTSDEDNDRPFKIANFSYSEDFSIKYNKLRLFFFNFLSAKKANIIKNKIKERQKSFKYTEFIAFKNYE